MNSLAQEVRRDDELSPYARLLFYEIHEMCEDEGRCFAENQWFADRLGTARSSIRRWLRDLRQAGYVHREHADGRRYLAPKDTPVKANQSPVRCDRGDQQKTKPASAPTEAATSDRGAVRSDRSPPVSSDHHRDNINPAEASEGAPARREDQGEEESSRVQKLKRLKQGAWTKEEIRQHAKRKYGDPERWRTAIYQLAHPDYDPDVLVRDEWGEKIADPEAWAEAIWKGLKRRWQPTSVDAREDTYEEIARHVGGDGQPVEYNARGYRIE
mgnify:CR=1 FL=1